MNGTVIRAIVYVKECVIKFIGKCDMVRRRWARVKQQQQQQQQQKVFFKFLLYCRVRVF